MNSKTAFNHFQRLETLLRDIWSKHICYCSPHKNILNEVNQKIHGDAALSKCPQWVRTKLNQIDLEKLKYVQQNRLVWLFLDSKGKPVAWDILTDAERQTYNQPNMSGKHYWLKEILEHGKFRKSVAGDVVSIQYQITDKVF